MTPPVFRPATRANVPLLIGFAGPTGSGKSWTSMAVGSGLAEGKRFAVIDTENGRASHYADYFAFDVAELRAPFSPESYIEAIKTADAAGYPVIVVDSMSHEYAGEGGILDMQEDELERMAGSDWKKREAVKMTSWIKPKTRHKHMVQQLLQVRAHLIFSFRAEEKIEMIRENGKTIIQKKTTLTGADGYVPITEKTLPYELTASLLLKPDRPGYVWPIKLQEQHRAFFPLDKAIGKEAGAALARWAKGEAPPGKPALSSILTAIKIAENMEQLKAVTNSAALLEGEDKVKATAAFKAKRDGFAK